MGRLSQKTVNAGGTGVTTAYTYLAGGHGTGSTTPLVQKMTQQGKTLTYAYDDAGNILSVNDGSKTVSYSYDMLGQLIRANDPYDTTAGSAGTTWVYSYDLGGNMTSKKAYAYTTGTVGTAVQTISYTYGDSNWKDKLTAYNGAAISYDAIGNPTSDGTWTYTWAKGRQLQSMSKSGTSVSYTYNEDGLRVQKNVSGTVTSYILHGKNVVELNQGGNVLHFFYGADGSPAVVVYNGAGYGYVKNLQGDIVSIVNSSGAEVVHYSYDAWGKLLSKTGTLATSLGTLNPFRYRGYVYDEETGLYYLRSRYYNPGWGRFVNADEIYEGNLYMYCYNNPTAFVDEDGELGQNFMHDAVCEDIVEKSGGTLHKIHVKIINIPGKQYGLADIRSDDGMVWEVKRVTCSPRSALNQLMGYINGIWEIDDVNVNKSNLRRGDDRPIEGIVTSVPGYIGFYANVGNGIILYDYVKLPTLQPAPVTAVEPAKERVRSRAPAYGGQYAIGLAIVAGLVTSMVMGGGGSGHGRITQAFFGD